MHRTASKEEDVLFKVLYGILPEGTSVYPRKDIPNNIINNIVDEIVGNEGTTNEAILDVVAKIRGNIDKKRSTTSDATNGA